MSQKIAEYRSNGAQGRNRTTDTAIFSRMLYQLSYLGAARIRSRERRFIVGPDSPVYTASPWTASVRHGSQGGFWPSLRWTGHTRLNYRHRT
jgi:hypothetical protein